MTKQEKIEWDKLYSYLKELMGYGTDQALKKTMVEIVMKLYRYICFENKYTFADLLEFFMQCEDNILEQVNQSTYESDIEKFTSICDIVRDYYNATFATEPVQSKDCLLAYHDEPVRAFETISCRIDPDIKSSFDFRVQWLKATENAENSRAVTIQGIIATLLSAFTVGKLDIKNVEGKLFLSADY